MLPASVKTLTVSTLGLLLAVLPLGCGSDGAAGPPGAQGEGPPGPSIDASTAPDALLAELDVVSEITGVTIADTTVVNFTVKTAEGIPIVGLVPFWQASNRFIRFTLTKLLPGGNGEPSQWVSYTRDANSGEPDYDTGSSLVDNEDGSYTFTFNTDASNVPGVAYEPTLTHRVAGQIGRYSTVPLEEQNLWLDFVPNGSAVAYTRSMATMQSCNECHDSLNFHGRRFKVQYCVQCHNSDLAEGEGDFGFMIHRIHAAGKFHVLDRGVSYEEVTYPQDVTNCQKCHNSADAATPEGDNWKMRPNMVACDGCHDVFNPNAKGSHTGGVQVNNARCTVCHSMEAIMADHATANSTPNNPQLPKGQRNISYELVDAVVDGSSNEVTVKFKILSGETPLDLTNLPADFKDGSGDVFRFPGLLLAWAQPQTMGGFEPADWNNLGRTGGQPLSLGLGDFAPIQTTDPVGTLTFNSSDGVMTAKINTATNQFPLGAKMRAVGLQGYLQQDLDRDGSSDVSLHALSAVVPVRGDTVRREIIDVNKCASCHEWFEGHGGNRVFGVGSDMVCTMCHVPNLSSSGRTLDLKHPEDSQNFKDMIHGIHASGFRTRDYEHVRNFRNGARIYNWSEVTFPRGASTGNCLLCHKAGTYELPLAANVLATTVRTTGVNDGKDATVADAGKARQSLPNPSDWVNSSTSSSCFYCHTSVAAWAHMEANGAVLSLPSVGVNTYANRLNLGKVESCVICHGQGKQADVKVVHGR